MIKLTKKKLITCLVYVISILCLATLVPVLRTPAFFVIKLPLKLFYSVGREVKALVFYHRNFFENQRLIGENELLRGKLVMMNEFYLENKRLKELLFFKQGSALKLSAARVIGRDPGDWSSGIIIDKGKSDGLQENQLIITGIGVAGKISGVEVSVSKAVLINDPRVNIPAMVERSRHDGLITGTLQRHLLMKYLPYEADIKVGDTIISSGLDGIYPKGVLIGKVVGLGYDSTGLSRQAIVEPAVDISKIEEVFVVMR